MRATGTVRRAVTRPVLPAITVAMILLTSACTTDTGPGAGAPSSASPSAAASPSPSPSADPSADQGAASVPDPPRGRHDRATARRFAEYALQAWIHALNTNDAGALLRVSGDRPCDGCAALRRELTRRERQGWYVALRDVRVRGADVVLAGRTARVRLTVDLPESQSLEKDGAYRSTNPAHPGSTFEVRMVHTRNRYRLTAFSLSDGPPRGRR